MKKKNVLMMALSLALVAVIAIGGTLAMLTAQDGVLTNTFTFAGNIKVDLWETVPGDSSLGHGQTGAASHEYGDIVPNTPIEKEVKVDIDAPVEAYVFVKVGYDVGEDPNANIMALKNMNVKGTAGEGANPWTLYQADDVNGNKGYGIYYQVANGADIDNVLIFDGVELEIDGAATSTNVADVTIEVSAVQSMGEDGQKMDVGTAFANAVWAE